MRSAPRPRRGSPPSTRPVSSTRRTSRTGFPRFRVNAFRQRGDISFAMRVIPDEVPTFDSLRLPPGVRNLAEEQRGLILVTGATGVGKTTTLAAMLGHINRTRQQHIVTIEDPIEILHRDERCIVNQREVGLDTGRSTKPFGALSARTRT